METPSDQLHQDNTEDNTQIAAPLPIDPNIENGYDAGVVTARRKETIRELKRDLSLLNRKVAKVTAAIRALESLEDDLIGDPSSTTGKVTPGSLNYPEAARAVLEKTNKALGVRQILEAMEKAGRPVATSKPYRTLYKVLKSHPEMFANVGGKWEAK